MGADGSCCSGGTDEALKAELDRYQRGDKPKDIKGQLTDITNYTNGENASQGQKSPYKKNKGR